MVRRQPVLVEGPAELEPTKEFLLEYRRAILCALAERGMLTTDQLDSCIKGIER